jgi:hypothetical protein
MSIDDRVRGSGPRSREPSRKAASWHSALIPRAILCRSPEALALGPAVLAAVGGPRPPWPRHDGPDAVTAHQSLDAATAHPAALSLQLNMDARAAIASARVPMDPFDVVDEITIGGGSPGAARLIAGLPRRPSRTIRVVLFGAEEMNFSGVAYAQTNQGKTDKILGVTCDPSRVTAILIPAPRYIPRKVTLIHGHVAASHREPRFGLSVHLNVKYI